MSDLSARTKSGSVEEFKASWRHRPEATYNHWTKGPVRNQIQLAFRSHWEVFSDLIGDHAPGRVMRSGVGGALFRATLRTMDGMLLCSTLPPEVIEIAKSIFANNRHSAEFVLGDALSLPFGDRQFDAVTSIGLLEHFEEPEKALDEQWRMLKPGGWLLCYIVPERPDNLQRHFNWLNWVLKRSPCSRRRSVFRSRRSSAPMADRSAIPEH